MPQPKKVVGVKSHKETEDVSDVMYFIRLVDKVRKSTNQAVIDDAFLKIVVGLEPKMKKIAGKFKIPGYNFDDIYQESLYALRYKAIKDYDQTRGSGEGPAPFDRFALLCIRRHLATTLKTSRQNRKKILNSCISLTQDRSSDSEELSLMNILPQTEGDVCSEITDKEYFRTLVNKLLAKLSNFEKQVFFLYAQQYTYEEISDTINDKYPHKTKVNIKGVDNALSRIKNKARLIFRRSQVAAGEKVDARRKPRRRRQTKVSRKRKTQEATYDEFSS
jgi:RNA polymerase sporulation-specific sigma factor